MTLIETIQVPLTTNEHGVIRVTGTRVNVESVLWSYKEGYTPEQIVDQFTTLKVADVYHIIGYYLEHYEEMEDYLAQVEQRREEVYREIDSRVDTKGLRERLLARRTEK